MAEQQKIHWAQDEDLLDRYLRGELGPDDRKRLDGHLETCVECAAYVVTERALVGGIRSFARKELKEDLRRQLRMRTSARTTALAWIGMAATIVLAVAIWYIPGDEPPLPAMGEQPHGLIDVTPEEDVERREAEREDTDITAGVEGEADQPTRLPSPAVRSESVSPSRDAAAGAAMRADESGRAELQILGEESVPREEKRKERWTLAVEMPRILDAGVKELDERASYMEARAADKKEGRQKSDVARAIQQVVLTQAPFARALQQVQNLSSERIGSIPVRITDTIDTLYVTLFPPEPWSETDVLQARVEELGDDSLKVRIGIQVLHFSKQIHNAPGQ